TTQATAKPLSPAQSILQRQCACGTYTMGGSACAACSGKKGLLQRKAERHEGVSKVPSIVYDVLRSPGQPLDAATRAFLEPRFGHDFSQVRVHTDAKAAESARAVNALAYTVGKNMVFAQGHYTAATASGQRLLAHELVHTMQQPSFLPARPLSLSNAN